MFIATISHPGYLPDSAEPAPIFDTAEEAWAQLTEDRKNFEEDHETYSQLPEYSHAVDAMRLLSDGDMLALYRLHPAASFDFSFGLNADLTGSIVAPSTLDEESSRPPYVYTVDIYIEES